MTTTNNPYGIGPVPSPDAIDVIYNDNYQLPKPTRPTTGPDPRDKIIDSLQANIIRLQKQRDSAIHLLNTISFNFPDVEKFVDEMTKNMIETETEKEPDEEN